MGTTTRTKNNMRDLLDKLSNIVETEEVAEVGMSDLRADLMQKMDYIEELMGGEALLNEIIMGMTTDELKENVEWIAQHHDIKFPGEEEDDI